MTSEYRVGSYYFPNYHVDPRNEAIHGPGWTEWELVKRGEPKFPGGGGPALEAGNRVVNGGFEESRKRR